MPLPANPWDKYAKERPLFYISSKSRWREEDEFWQSGERTITYIWEHVVARLPRRRLAIELGVGIGRLAVPVARKFNRVKVVDASPFMLQHLQHTCARFGVCNFELFRDHDPWDTEPADFVYSALMFQHIEDVATIDAYIRRTASCLAGVAYFQFDTRPMTLGIRVRNRMPDWTLPKLHRHGIRRIRRRSADLRAMFERHGLRILDELQPDSILHAFIVARDTSEQ